MSLLVVALIANSVNVWIAWNNYNYTNRLIKERNDMAKQLNKQDRQMLLLSEALLKDEMPELEERQ